MEHHYHNQQMGSIYTCPMHPEIRQDKPGNCPICGMKLVPAKAKTGNPRSHQQDGDSNPAVRQEQQSSKKYTCPMHPQIIQDGPGKCRLWGMTLVPLTKSKANGSHESHLSGIVDFRKRFYVVLGLTIPIMLLSDMI